MSIDRSIQSLSIEEFDKLIQQFGPFANSTHFAVATSGGPDSLCLVALMARWAATHRHKVTALIVDHGLRIDSTYEAQFVAQQLSKAEIKAEILTWHGVKPITRIQERARQARYKLLLEWCQLNNCRYLLVGHHAQDQQETAWWRLYRGSDLYGLAGMSALTQQEGIQICRPLLGITKERLRATLADFALKAVEDPSNLNERFSRVRIRNHLEHLPALPVQALGHLRQAFEQWRSSFIQQNVALSKYGFIEVKLDAFLTLTLPFQEVLMNHLLRVISNRPFPVRRKDMANLLESLQKYPATKRTLAGCIIEGRADHLLIMREWCACPYYQIAPLFEEQTIMWDGRFILKFQPTATLLTLTALGVKGWQQLCHQRNIEEELASIPYPARLALPALWNGDQLFTLCHFQNMASQNSVVKEITLTSVTPLLPLPFKLMV